MNRRQLLTGLRMTIALVVLLGLAYPLTMTAVAQVLFGDAAEGSVVEQDGVAVGSSLIGQAFTRPEYFHPRPSAAGDGYDGLASAGSNLGPSSSKLRQQVDKRVAAYRDENRLPANARVPVDAVTASASGLDPHISVANARLQAQRVAAARGVDPQEVLDLVDRHTDSRPLGVLGEAGVNVLLLNLALDQGP